MSVVFNSSADPDEVGFSSKRLSQHILRTASSSPAQTRVKYARRAFELALDVVCRPCSEANGSHSGNRVETYAFDTKGRDSWLQTNSGFF